MKKIEKSLIENFISEKSQIENSYSTEDLAKFHATKTLLWDLTSFDLENDAREYVENLRIKIYNQTASSTDKCIGFSLNTIFYLQIKL